MKYLSLLSLAVITTQAGPLKWSRLLVEKQAGSDTTVTAADLANFEFFAQYAGAAYCNSNSTNVGQPITCDENVCDDVEADGAVVTAVVDGDSSSDIMAFIATDPARQLVVVSFRGTSSIRNWIADVEFVFTDCDLTSGCEAHDGFWNSWTQSASTVMSAVAAALSANPSYSLVVTGHSLGGAVATLAGGSLRNAGYPCDIYTYGSPRVGNGVLADYVTGQPGGEYRVTHLDDPVPKLPPMFLGYRHTSPEYWLDDGTATTTDYSTSDIKVCIGDANADCNASTGGLDVTAHDYYFEDISACGPPGISFRRHRRQSSMTDAEITQEVDQWAAQDVQYAHSL